MMHLAVEGSPKKHGVTPGLHLGNAGYLRMGKPKFGPRAEIPPEVFQLLSALESAAEAVGARFREDLKVPAWRREADHQLSRLTQLLLVARESGRPPICSHLDDLEERVARLEAVAPPMILEGSHRPGPAKIRRGGAR
jgi:hypothetical protein